MVQGMVAWGRLLHSRPYLCRAWVFWREGVVVSVKGQVGSSLVFWVLGERGEKNGGGGMLLLPLFSARPGEEEGLWCRSKRHHLLFIIIIYIYIYIFLRGPKNGLQQLPPLYNAYGAKILRSKCCKDK